MVGPLDTRRLLIMLASADDHAPYPGDMCCVHDVHTLIDRVLDSRTVLIERRDGTVPLRLRSRAARESELTWLSRVMTEVVGQLTDTALACAVASETIRRTSSTPVVIECRPPDDAILPSLAAESRPWPERSGDMPLVRSARGDWTLVCPNGSLGPAAEYQVLLAALTRCLCASDADEVRARNVLRQQLVRAVSCPDPVAFVEAAAALVGGSVCLRDSHGSAVAAAGSRPGTHRASDIALRDESGLRGVLEIDSARAADTDLGLADLAVALLRLRSADAERDELENRLAVLGCFVEREVDGRYPAGAARPRRVVLITPHGAGKVSAVRCIVGRVLRTAADIPLLADLSLTARDDALVGVYSDDGSHAGAHRHAWQRLLAAVGGQGSLLVAVSTSAPHSGGSRAQYQLVSQVGQLQRDGVDLFDLPAVAVLDELGPLAGVLNAVPGTQVTPYVQRVLGDLITDGRFGGQLIETLYAYLQAGGSPRGAGALLHLHGSSVKYRMRILRELLGERLDDPGKRFDLELALRLYLAARELSAGVSR
jgi:hypothetical protein